MEVISFQEFSTNEVDVGLSYASATCGVGLTREVLRVSANQAGAIRKAKHVVPRVAAVEALRAYERRNHIDIDARRYEAYIKAIAKMLAERSPRTAAKRRREAELAELKAAS